MATPPPPAALPELRPVTALPGVGPALAEKLAKLEVFTVQDVLFLLPLRYEDRTRIVPIGSLQSGGQGGRRRRSAACGNRVSRQAPAHLQDRGRLRVPHTALLPLLWRSAGCSRTRGAHSLLRRGEARPSRSRDRPPRVPPCRSGRRPGNGRRADSGLPRYGRCRPGSTASTDRVGAEGASGRRRP